MILITNNTDQRRENFLERFIRLPDVGRRLRSDGQRGA